MKIIFFFPFFLSKAWNKKNIHESHCWNVSMRIPSILNFWERGKKKQKKLTQCVFFTRIAYNYGIFDLHSCVKKSHLRKRVEKTNKNRKHN